AGVDDQDALITDDDQRIAADDGAVRFRIDEGVDTVGEPFGGEDGDTVPTFRCAEKWGTRGDRGEEEEDRKKTAHRSFVDETKLVWQSAGRFDWDGDRLGGTSADIE